LLHSFPDSARFPHNLHARLPLDKGSHPNPNDLMVIN
jgi:hypothetical protein